MPQPKGWRILKRFYAEALKYDQKWQLVYHSMSLSIRGCAGQLASDDPVKAELLEECLTVCTKGISFCPESALLYGSRGRTHYELRNPEATIVDSEKSALNRYQKNSGLLFSPSYLIDAAQGDLKQELEGRTMELLKQNDMMHWL